MKKIPNAASFKMLPTALLENPQYAQLSPTALVAYALICDRCKLSAMKEHVQQYSDKDGRVYCAYLLEGLASAAHCGTQAMRTAMRQLIACELIECKRIGQGKANHYYLLVDFCTFANDTTAAPETPKSHPLETTPAVVLNVDKSNQIHTQSSKTKKDIYHSDRISSHLWDADADADAEKIAAIYENFEQTEDPTIFHALEELLTAKDGWNVNKTHYSHTEIIHYLSIAHDMIISNTYAKLKNAAGPITALSRYLASCLLQSAIEEHTAEQAGYYA